MTGRWWTIRSKLAKRYITVIWSERKFQQLTLDFFPLIISTVCVWIYNIIHVPSSFWKFSNIDKMNLKNNEHIFLLFIFSTAYVLPQRGISWIDLKPITFMSRKIFFFVVKVTRNSSLPWGVNYLIKIQCNTSQLKEGCSEIIETTQIFSYLSDEFWWKLGINIEESQANIWTK